MRLLRRLLQNKPTACILLLLLSITVLAGCSDGWSVMGWEVHCPEIENKEVGE